MNGTFVIPKGILEGKGPSSEKGEITDVADRAGFPLAVYATSSGTHQVTLTRTTLAEAFINK